LSFSKPFIKASATSTYEKEGSPGMYSAEMALGNGSGYWVSEGDHGEEDTVSFEGQLKHRHRANGVRINWAYAPGQVRVRTSGDGKHFGDSICWTKENNNEETFEEFLKFDRPRNVQAIRIDMKEPRPWRFFGINNASLY